MRVTLQDVANAVGVSRQVVATVLTGQGTARASAETREKVLAVARDMGYRAHAAARTLATGKTRNIELQSHAMGDSIYHLPLHHLPLWSAIAQCCQEREYNLLLVSRHDENGQALMRNLSQHNVDGLILLGVSDFEVLERAKDEGIPALCVNPEIAPAQLAQAGHDVINFNNVSGIRAAVEYLAGLGHRDIGFVRGASRNSDFAERWQSFQDTMGALGLPLREEWIWHTPPWVKCGEEVGGHILHLQKRPTALLAANDNLALGLMRALLASGMRIPQEISVMGFDDIEASALVYPGLTTVQLDWSGMGRLAAERLISLVEESEEPAKLSVGELRYPLRLIERQSCRSLIRA